MDLKANKQEQLKIAQEILDLQNSPGYNSISVMRECTLLGDRLSELVISLHEWETKGGF